MDDWSKELKKFIQKRVEKLLEDEVEKITKVVNLDVQNLGKEKIKLWNYF